MLNKMKNKTYHNFLVVRNLLMREKGYSQEESNKIAHLIFENYNLDNTRTIRDYFDRILPKEEFELQQS